MSDLLKPPSGSRLVRAVGTSFTLDLTAALGVPLAFAGRDLGSSPDPIGVMEAVRGAADRIDIFYQAGQASVPAQASDVMAFLEPVLHATRAPRPGHLFHPKVWLLKYADPDDGNVTYRFICSSRNLTHDRSWDAVVSLDGSAGSTRDARNEPLRRFILALPGMCTHPLDPDRRSAVSALADEVRRVSWEWPEDTKAWSFHPLGIGGPAPQLNFRGYRRLVVSPFVELDGMARVAPDHVADTVLVSRPEHMDRLTPLPPDLDLRAMSVLAELEEDRVAGELSGLHAKLILVERNRLAHFFIGSANATGAAFNGNVEFMVEVVRGAAKYGVAAHLDEEEGLGLLLEPYVQQTPVDDDEADRRYALQDWLRRAAALAWTARPAASTEVYELSVESGAPLPETTGRVTLELTTRRGEARELAAAAAVGVSFTGLPLADITPFLVLTVEENGLRESTVVPAVLLDDPDSRFDAVLARQVDTPEKFLRFLLLILGLTQGSGQETAAGIGAGSWSGASGPALFELMARSLSDNPAALDDLARIVERLERTEEGRAVLPPGFTELWSVLLEARVMTGAAS